MNHSELHGLCLYLVEVHCFDSSQLLRVIEKPHNWERELKQANIWLKIESLTDDGYRFKVETRRNGGGSIVETFTHQTLMDEFMERFTTWEPESVKIITPAMNASEQREFDTVMRKRMAR